MKLLNLFVNKNKIKIVKNIKDSWGFSSNLRGRDHYQDGLKTLFIDGGNINNSEVFNHIEVIREPDNKYDKNAIYVAYKGKKIGYISKERVELIKDVKEITDVKLRPYIYKEKYSAEVIFNY